MDSYAVILDIEHDDVMCNIDILCYVTPTLEHFLFDQQTDWTVRN